MGDGFMKRIFSPTWMRYGRIFFCAPLFLRISEKNSTVQRGWGRKLWSPFVAFSLMVVGGWTRTKTPDPAPCHLARIVATIIQGYNNLLLSDQAVLVWVGIWSLLPSVSSCSPVFLTRKTAVQALLPPHAEEQERYHPWMPRLETEKVDFQAALFISFPKKSILSPSSSSLPLPLSSFTQVGRESGTSRRRRLTLYNGANYPLLYGRMGRGGRSGATEGRGGKRQDWRVMVEVQEQEEVSDNQPNLVMWHFKSVSHHLSPGWENCLDSDGSNFEAVHAFHTYCILATKTVAMEKATYNGSGCIIFIQQDGGTSCWGLAVYLYPNMAQTLCVLGFGDS